jgi:hypothetical protein
LQSTTYATKKPIIEVFVGIVVKKARKSNTNRRSGIVLGTEKNHNATVVVSKPTYLLISC